MSDEESNFKSAIQWPDDIAKREVASKNSFEPLRHGLIKAFGHLATPVSGSESPIEDWFGSGLAILFSQRVLQNGASFAIAPPRSNERPAHFVLIPQFVVGNYRYDFALAISGEDRPILLIECDSKMFHSSAEQIKNDANKTEEASKAGIKLVRIKGGAIHHEYEKCVNEVLHDFVLESFRRTKKDFSWLESAQ